jgi:small subunit ribosomal protein S15
MSFNTQEKQQIVKEFQQHDHDTGSTEVQVALITAKIEHISKHLKAYGKDFSSKRGLLVLVSQRRRLLKYLSNKNERRYQLLIGRLGLKK